MMDPSCNRNPPEKCSRPLFSWNFKQEDLTIPHPDQGEEPKDIKPEVKEEKDDASSGNLGDIIIIKEEHNEDEKYGVLDQFSEEHKEPCKEMTPSCCTNPLESFTRPLDSWNFLQEDHPAPHYDRTEKPKAEVKEEGKEPLVSVDEQSMKEEDLMNRQDSILQNYTITYHDQESNDNKTEVKEEEDEQLESIDEQSLEEESPLSSRDFRNAIPRHDQDEELEDIKPEMKEEDDDDTVGEELKYINAVIKEEEETLAKEAHREEGERNPTWSLHIDTDGDFVWNRCYTCSDCGKSFVDRGDFVKHAIIHNSGKDFELKGCLNSQKSQTDKHHFSCSMCGKIFNEKEKLLTHQRSHTGERPFLCSECGKYFVSKAKLLLHQKRHTGECPYPCSECRKCFAQKGDLVKHQRIHTGERPYTCSECGKSFTEKRSLSNHQKLHTGERPYSCLECGNSYIDKQRLNKHQMRHAGERPFSCLECGKGFIVETALAEHQRKHKQ